MSSDKNQVHTGFYGIGVLLLSFFIIEWAFYVDLKAIYANAFGSVIINKVRDFPIGMHSLIPIFLLMHSFLVLPKKKSKIAGIIFVQIVTFIASVFIYTLYYDLLFLPLGLIPVLYPILLVAMIWGSDGIRRLLGNKKTKLKDDFKFYEDTKRDENDMSFHLKTENGWLNVTAPQRGVVVVGMAGAGKSFSSLEPFCVQAVDKDFTGLIYDFKFPTLTNLVYSAYKQKKNNDVGLIIVNFTDLSKTHRVNPIHPKILTEMAYATEFADAIIKNLSDKKESDFWSDSSRAILASLMWFLKKNFPEYCTLPHVFLLILQEDYNQFVEMALADPEAKTLILSLATAIKQKAGDQIAGTVSTLQVNLAKLTTPKICYVLSGNDFTLDLNNPKDKKLLCLGSAANLKDSLAPVIGTILSVLAKELNQQGRHKSVMLQDEFPTYKVPNYDEFPATARSNKVCSIIGIQDYSQMEKVYSPVEQKAILANHGNLIVGQVKEMKTAKDLSEKIGKRDRVTQSSESDSDQKGQTGGGSTSNTTSSKKEVLIDPSEITNFLPGEMAGQLTNQRDKKYGNFHVQVKEKQPLITQIRENLQELPSFNKGVNEEDNYAQLIQEVEFILGNYKERLAARGIRVKEKEEETK